MSRAIPTTALALLLTAPVLFAQGRGGGNAQAPARIPSIEERTTGMQKLDGYFPVYWDERTGSLFLEIPRFDHEFLLTTGLAGGLGSNDIGLDRGQQSGGRIVYFERIGPKILLIQPQESFRSSSPNPAEVRSVADSFAKSVLFGFTVAAETSGHVLVDATDFVLRDGLMARPLRYGRDLIAWTARASRCSWNGPRRFPRTPRSKSR